MPLSLVPGCLFERYQEVTPEYLRRHGVTLLLSDLEFTLAPKSCLLYTSDAADER